MKKITLVLGMHRTGTSLLTSVLHDLGYHPGNDLLEADMYNLNGYWEYKPLLNLHERMLADYGNLWYAPGHIMPLNELLTRYRDEAETLIRTMDACGQDWCWKEPRLVIFLDFWLEILADRNVKWIITHRNPAAIAHSLKSRNHFDIKTGLTLWEYSMMKLMSKRDKLKGAITIQYEEMLSDPKQQIDRIAAYLKPECDDQNLIKRCEAAALRIKSDAIHQRDYSDVILTEQQKRLEMIIRDGLDTQDICESETIMSNHRRYFRKLLRDISIEQDQRIKKLESEHAADHHKIAELDQVIQVQNQKMKEMNRVSYFIRSRINGLKSKIRL